jgi:competence protein ComEC
MKISHHTIALLILGGVFLGVVVGNEAAYVTELSVLALLMSSIYCAIYGVLYFRQKRTGVYYPHKEIPLVCGIVLFAFFITIVRLQMAEEKSTLLCPKVCTFSGYVSESPKIRRDVQVLTVKPLYAEDLLSVEVTTSLYPRYRAYDVIEVTGTVLAPPNLMPHDTKKFFDYTRFLHMQSMGSQMYYPRIVQSDDVKQSTSTLLFLLTSLRENMTERIGNHSKEPARSLTLGMLFGSDQVNSDLVQLFRNSGISHIIVLSGFNIAVIISFILFVLVVVPLYLRVAIAGICVVLFVMMVGATPSVLRATTMSAFALLALLFGRLYVARQALILSLIGIILYEPRYVLYDVSLHLSFLATAGIIYLNKEMEKFFSFLRFSFLKTLCATSLSAYLATLPYVMFTFGTVTTYALVANIFVVPLVPIIMSLGGLVLFFSYFLPLVAVLIGFLLSLLCGYIILISSYTASFPYASFEVTVPLSVMVGMYVSLITLFVYRTISTRRKHRNETCETKHDEIVSGTMSY